MKDLQQKPSPFGRAFSALAALFGVALAVFEVSQIRKGEHTGWFWLLVAVLMIVMGAIGAVQGPSRQE